MAPGPAMEKGTAADAHPGETDPHEAEHVVADQAEHEQDRARDQGGADGHALLVDPGRDPG